jgi:molybdate transport system substrate-binding protein
VRVAALLVAAALALSACGGGDDEPDELIVSAATSLKRPFTTYGEAFRGARVRLSFAGSDELAAQIRQGVRPDVYAAANTTLPRELFADGFVEEPVAFAHNQLVLAVPADGDIDSLDDLERDGVKLAIGSERVPVGSYTRDVLSRLAPERSRRILANVRSEEPDVAGIIGKLSQGAVDAGFVYATDVVAAGARLRTIDLPARIDADVEYGAAVVAGAKHPEQARAFVRGLRRGAGARALENAGFGLFR